ncbi:MAG: hypothetical protein GY863_22280 [bacterium]|nr:hypothetical protein [bacterium]
MDIFLFINTFILLILMAFAVYVLVHIRRSLKDIYKELNYLEDKVHDRSLPENKIVNLNIFSEKLKKILEGMKNINPDSE